MILVLRQKYSFLLSRNQIRHTVAAKRFTERIYYPACQLYPIKLKTASFL